MALPHIFSFQIEPDVRNHYLKKKAKAKAKAKGLKLSQYIRQLIIDDTKED